MVILVALVLVDLSGSVESERVVAYGAAGTLDQRPGRTGVAAATGRERICKRVRLQRRDLERMMPRNRPPLPTDVLVAAACR